MNSPALNQIYRDKFIGEQPDPSPLALANQAPPWRKFADKPTLASTSGVQPRSMDLDQAIKGRNYLADPEEAKLVNAALVLRRPILITGQAGIGKTTLAYSVAWQLGLGNVLRWGVTSRSTLKDALYHYDALARLHDASLWKEGVPDANLNFGDYFTLGPLGTALLPNDSPNYLPRVLLIDEIDKSDADLPSDLLHVLEEGRFSIPEVDRLPASQKGATVLVKSADNAMPEVKIPSNGDIRCNDFPLILMTSNGDRDFPPAFLRRCLQLSIPWERRAKQLDEIIKQHLGISSKDDPTIQELLELFNQKRTESDATLAIDQLLNAIFLARSRVDVNPLDHQGIKDAIFKSLSETPQAPTL
ncbi:MAG: MoxR family ATPase [Planctomycetota bacterium]